MLGLTAGNKLIRFNSNTGGSLRNTVDVTGLQTGEVLLGIDFRPATGQLYGLGRLQPPLYGEWHDRGGYGGQLDYLHHSPGGN